LRAQRSGEIRWDTSTDEYWEDRGSVYNGWLSLEVPPAQVKSLHDFDVHIILRRTSGVENGDKACAEVSALRIEGE